MTKREFHVSGEHPYNRGGPVRWILSHAFRYPWLPVVNVVGAALSNLAVSYRQVFIGQGFDLVARSGWELRQLGRLALALLGVSVLQGVMGIVRSFSIEFLAQRIERDAREELYISLLGKSQTFHARQRIGDVMARATNDVRMLNYMFSPGLMLIIDSLFNIAVPIVLIAQLGLDLLLVPAIFLVLMSVTLVDYNRRLHPVSAALREQFGVLNAGLEEIISGIEIVKAYVQEEHAWHKFTDAARRYRDLFVKVGEIEAFYLPMLMFSLCWAGGLLHALLVWREGRISLGEAVSFMGLLGMLRFPTFMSMWTFDLVQQAVAGARRILEMINTETELDENEGGYAQPMRGEVVFEHVSFRYNDKLVLRDISFTVKPGETVAIVGQTGSGKTTLTRLINRIFDVNEGRVLVDGVDVRDWNLEALRSQISVIEQDIFLFSRSIAENIAFGCADASQDAIEEAARAAQAHEFIMSFRDGYQTEVGERGVTLSGGQRQRIAIARAFLTTPRILILDDSTSAIDSATEDQIQRAMRRIARGRTSFIITHRLSQIRWADRILVLQRGELVDQGTHAELMSRCEVYRRIFQRYD